MKRFVIDRITTKTETLVVFADNLNKAMSYARDMENSVASINGRGVSHILHTKQIGSASFRRRKELE